MSNESNLASPTIREIGLALSSSSPRVREAALAVRPPSTPSQEDLQIVRQAVREQEAKSRGGVDVKV